MRPAQSPYNYMRIRPRRGLAARSQNRIASDVPNAIIDRALGHYDQIRKACGDGVRAALG